MLKKATGELVGQTLWAADLTDNLNSFVMIKQNIVILFFWRNIYEQFQ